MNDPRRPPDHDPDLDAESLFARDAVHGLPPVKPEPAYRAGLRTAFASGEIAAKEARAESEPERERELVRLPFPSRHRLWTGLAVGLALVVAVVTGVLNQGSSWRVAGVRGEGSVLLDGASYAAGDAALTGRRIPPGTRVEVTNAAELDLRADGVMMLQVVGGSDLILPPSPPRWFARRSSFHVERGEIRVTTGPAFQGARLEITTPDAAIAATGTTFAVILEPTGTCVCVLEGTVAVGPRDNSPAPVSSGNLRYVFRDGRAPAEAAMRDMERVKLAAFRAASMPSLETSTP